jgi:nucleotide-binding universal stress UspA family protein
MMGDDWLNNVSTREAYCKHVESQLAGEITRHQQSLCTRAEAAGAQYSSRVVIGKPAECLLEFAAETEPALIVVGSPRPRGVAGLRSRMRMETLVSALRAPLLVVPHPK